MVLGLFLLVWDEATALQRRRRAGEGAGKLVIAPGDSTEYAGPATQGGCDDAWCNRVVTRRQQFFVSSFFFL